MAKGKNTAGILAGLLAGAAAGVVLGMLYAPEEGKATRKKIRSKANDAKIGLKINTVMYLKK